MRIRITVTSIGRLILACMILHSMSFFSPKLGNSNLDISVTDVSSDITSRLIWIALAIASLIVAFYRRAFVLSMFKAAWPLWLLLGIATISLSWSSEPEIAFIRLSQQYILILCAVACGVGILSKSTLINSLLTAITFVILFDLLLFATGKGWTDIGFAGFHGHKNSAGLIFAIAILVYYASALYDSGWRRKASLVLCAASSVLLYFSDSKTSTWLCFTIIALHLPLYLRQNLEPRRFGWYSLLGVLAAFIVMAIGFSYLRTLGITFTGRLDIWQFVFDKLRPYWLSGFGYASFWAMGDSSLNVLYGANYAGFITQLNQAHNSYLDVLLTLGFVGLISLGLFLFSLAYKIETYHKQAGSDAIVCLFSLLLAFTLSHALLESTLLRGYNPAWMMMLLMYFFLGTQIARKTRWLKNRRS